MEFDREIPLKEIDLAGGKKYAAPADLDYIESLYVYPERKVPCSE